jgi:hypothetical protein
MNDASVKGLTGKVCAEWFEILDMINAETVFTNS